MLPPFTTYWIVINIICFFMMGYDKTQAKRGNWRVPEKRFFLLSLIGGALGTWIAMRVWRHKTKHPTFTLGIPALLLLNFACAYFLWRSGFY